MTIEVYWGCGSPYSWRVLLALELKGMPYQSRRLSFSEKELKSADFLAINPRAQVPAIRDGEFSLYESIAILSYLDAKQPEPPLFGGSAGEQGMVWRLIMECVYYLEPHMTSFAGTIFCGELPQKRQEVIESRQAVEQELARIGEVLTENDYLAGSVISAADIVFYPVIQLLIIAARREDTGEISGKLRNSEFHYPSLFAWCQRIEALPGFERTNPPHWKA